MPSLGLFYMAMPAGFPTEESLADADSHSLVAAHHRHPGLLDLLSQTAWSRLLCYHWQHRGVGIGMGCHVAITYPLFISSLPQDWAIWSLDSMPY